jgi:hypothetical protein
MKRALISLLFFTMAALPIINAQNKGKTTTPVKVEILYFHPMERCPIDLTIEENVTTIVQTFFSKQIKDGTITFRVLNTDDKANAKTVAKFSINAQALYIVKHDKGTEIKNDLTDFAFSNSQNNPSKFKARLQDEIENALK